MKRLSVLFAWLLIAMPLVLTAQDDTTTSDEVDDTEIFELSPFQVAAREGYIATESTTGTRVKADIIELPYAVNVVTAEFIDDFAANRLEEQFGHVSSFAPDGQVEGEYQIRGIRIRNQLRNGFTRLGLIDYINVERAEVIKGPAAAIYGKINPGGIINIVTKRPLPEPQQRLRGEWGTDDYYRFDASTTGPLNDSGSLLYRADIGFRNEDSIAYSFRRQATYSGVLQWYPSDRTEIVLELEYLDRTDSRPRGLLPYRVDNTVDGVRDRSYFAPDERLWDFSFVGPAQRQRRDINTYELRIEHEINDIWSMRVGMHHYDRGFDNWTSYPSQVLAPRRRDSRGESPILNPYEHPIEEFLISFPEPVLLLIEQEGVAMQTDFLARFDAGNIRHQLLITLDYLNEERADVDYRLNRALSGDEQAIIESVSGIPVTTGNLTRDLNWVDRQWGVADPLGAPGGAGGRYWGTTESITRQWVTDVDRFSNATGTYGAGRRERDNTDDVEVRGIFISDRMELMDGRLLVNLGMRYDEVDTQLTAATTEDNNETLRAAVNPQSDSWTYQFGANFEVSDNVFLYANTSTSFIPQTEFRVVDPDTGLALEQDEITLFDNEEGVGYEVGIKASVLDGDLNFTLNAFQVNRENIAITVRSEVPDATEPDGFRDISYRDINGEEQARGVELDFSYQPNNSLQIIGGIGLIDSEIIKADDVSTGTPSIRQGLPVAQVPDYNFGVTLKHTYRDGDWKGFYQGLSVRGAGNSRATDSSGRELLENQAYEVFDGFIGYRWRPGNGDVQHTLQVNVKNMFDERYTIGQFYREPGRRFIFRYDIRF